MSETVLETSTAPAKKNTGKILAIVGIVLVVCCLCTIVIALIIYLVAAAGPVKVAILDYDSDTDVSYWTGGIGNDWSIYEEILSSDPDDRFEVSIIRDYDLDKLNDFSVLILPDNAIPDRYLADVLDWLQGGTRRIIAIDSAITYVSYAGLMWEGAGYTNGEGVYWNYESGSDDLYLVDGPLTSDFFTTAILSSNSSDAQMFRSRLPDDAVILAESAEDPSMIYVACRKVPGGGTVFVLGPFEDPEYDVYDLIRSVVHARSCK